MLRSLSVNLEELTAVLNNMSNYVINKYKLLNKYHVKTFEFKHQLINLPF